MATLSAPIAKDEPVVRFVRPPHAPGLELVHYPNLTRGWRGIPETYTWFTMIDRLQGDVDVISRGVQAECAPGSVTVGAPGEPYILRPRSPMCGEFRVIRVYQSLYAGIRDEIGVPSAESPFPRAPQRDPVAGRAFNGFYRAINEGDTLEIQERTFRFLAVLVTLGRRDPALRRDCDPRGVGRARELLRARFDGPVSLAELARHAGTDRFALLRAFSREVGMTPHEYQIHLRIARACRLIAKGLPLADVAIAVGYSEQSALHRPFTRHVGVTPGAYARAAGS